MFWLPKSFWAACLSWCCFRRAAPRAVGSVCRVGLLARPSSAVGCGGRLRGSFVAACLPLLFGGCRTRQEARDAQGRLAAGATGPGTFGSRSDGC